MRHVLKPLVASAVLVAALASVGGAADEEMVKNPAYEHWSAFKVGTTATQKEKVKFPKGSDDEEYHAGGIHEKDMTYTLLSVTPEKAVVQLTITEYGPGTLTELAPLKISYLARVPKAHVSTSKAEIEIFKEGDEEVTVLGKAIRCHWIEITDKDGDEVLYHKMWTSDDVPGGIVKDIKIQKKGQAPVSESEQVVTGFKKG